ncbi:hypothetical protein [Natronomonas sp. EA1]|uniref:hypothetical protein n=1 Tax=Natronomonas sp. EA1 TaxID=3421655 RepID=UPI003EBFB3EB
MEDLVESDYESALPTGTGNEEDHRRRHHDMSAFNQPGRTRHDDSINASSDDPGGSPHEDAYSAGYDSPMATRIGDEGDGDDDAERLRRLHDGRHHSDGDLPTRQSEWDKTRIAEAICSDLPLAKHEREKVISVVETLDFSRFGQQKGLEGVTLGVVAVVVDEHHRQHEDVAGDIVSFTDEYRQICSSLDVSMSDLGTIKELVREALVEGDATIGRREPRRDPNLPEPTPMEEYPRKYWDNRGPEYWVSRAKGWSKLPDEFKEATPDDYRQLVQNLRRWEPWEETESEPAQDEAPTPSAPEDVEDTLDDLEAELDLDEEIEMEAEQLLDELEDEQTE